MFHNFTSNISSVPLPEKFTFPFYYEPHELCKIAAQELQNYLVNQNDFDHNFGLDKNQSGPEIGKMFGVLVVQNQKGELGHLWAFSGKLADSNQHAKFVPTVYDMLAENGFFKKEETVLNEYNQALATLEQNQDYRLALHRLEEVKFQAVQEISAQKRLIKSQKKIRSERRKSATPEVFEQLNKESQEEGILLKKMTQYWNYKLEEARQTLAPFAQTIQQLKEERKEKSAALQQQLFTEYAFFNQFNEIKSLFEIFNGNPPAGAGECAAPKLLHYAFQHQWKPIAMAEFWWGKSPKSEVRRHRHFYPACKGKCEPILAHMLQGIAMDENPFEINFAIGKKLEIIYEDEYILAVNKPAEFLSVPGKLVTDSVQTRLQLQYPGCVIAHRLDMSTSGVVLVGKNQDVYKKLQQQFIKRSLSKEYIAVVEGILEKKEGTISLPLRVDLDNRPYQLVCREYGKEAVTHWKKIKISDGKTRVQFFPVTGRTHQLRVHAAHQLGLNLPILGDDLYGSKADRLYLHASKISFVHPTTQQQLVIEANCPF